MIDRSITVTEAARHFSDLINRVRYRHEGAILLKGGKPVARIGPVRTATTGRELVERMNDHPWLEPEEAELFASDVFSARGNLPQLQSKWE
jgi:prevent-host-death family protein